MYRLNVNATEEQIAYLLEEFTVRELDGQMLHKGKTCGTGRLPVVWYRKHGKHIQHSLAKVAWLLAFGVYPDHNVSFVDGTRDCRASNLKRTTRKPMC